MLDIVCGLLGDRAEAGAGTVAGRARDLSVAWLRWHYFGEIIEARDVERILRRAQATGRRYCLIQGYGHIVAEHAGPDGGKARGFFEALESWVGAHDFIVAGVPGRCVLVDLAAWSRAGKRALGAPMPFGPALEGHLIDLGADLSAAAPFEAFLDEMCDKAGRGVFVLNYESYDDVAEPPPGFAGPVSTLYCVAAGLKPNRILATHGMGADSRVVFFDYSADALDFRRRLNGEWDGRDYPRYLRALFERGGSTHYYLWPGATPENMDWRELERLWAAELGRWGGEDAFAEHWRAFQAIDHEYLACNILEPDALIARIEDAPGGVIWWSNAFSTIYSAAHHSLEEKRRMYADWIEALAERAPGVFLYGSDHSNSSVNAITAGEYRTRYFAEGGDPLSARSFHRQAIRF